MSTTHCICDECFGCEGSGIVTVGCEDVPCPTCAGSGLRPDTRANLERQVAEMRAALEDMLSGWRYIRYVHGDLSGVGWDRAESAARAALDRHKEARDGE